MTRTHPRRITRLLRNLGGRMLVAALLIGPGLVAPTLVGLWPRTALGGA